MPGNQLKQYNCKRKPGMLMAVQKPKLVILVDMDSSSFCSYLAIGSVCSGPRCPDFTTTTRLDKSGFLIVASEGWEKKKAQKFAFQIH